MNRIRHVVSSATVALGLAFAPAAMAVGHGEGGFGGHFGGFGGHVGGFGSQIGGFGGEHSPGPIAPALGGHSFDAGHLAAGGSLIGGGHGLAGGFTGGGHELDSFAGGGHELGNFEGGERELNSFASGGHELGGLAGTEHNVDRGSARGRHDMGDGLFLDSRAIGGEHLMYGRLPRFGRGGVFLGYYLPDPATCYQYPGDYNPAVGCYGLEPLG
jgi:hypothetical protein